MSRTRILILTTLLLTANWTRGQAHFDFSVTAGGGTSWIILPKVFLVDPQNVINVWQIAPATNSMAFYARGDAFYHINEHFLVSSGLGIQYMSGEINVTSLALQASAIGRQAYLRLDIPFLFGVKSADNFWVAFGPGLFFNIHDNNGFKNAVAELTTVDDINSNRPAGVNVKVGMGISLTDRFFLDLMFSSDLGHKFYFENDIYQVRLSMQSATVGFSWLLSKP